MKAIETVYRGYRFRSRLEARWAVFFDAMDFDWEYEVEGFVLDDGTHYLPDFKVTGQYGKVTWYEVKGKHSQDDEKLKKLKESFNTKWENEGYKSSELQFFKLLVGDPLDFLGENPGERLCVMCGNTLDDIRNTRDCSLYCYPCDISGNFDNDVLMQGVFIKSWFHKGDICFNEADVWYHDMQVLTAAKAARSARFEHGECG